MPRKKVLHVPPSYRFTVDDVTYDSDTHTSTLPDGQKVPHVTEVLGCVGVATDFDELAALSNYVAEKIETARLRGTAVHADCHAYDDTGVDGSSDLVWESMHPQVRPFVESWRTCREDKGLVPLAHGRERRVYHPLFNYTGILDGVFMCRQKRILLDLKTGDPESAAAHLQTAAYEAAWTMMFPHLPIDQRWAVQLTPRLRVPYRIKNYTAREDAHCDIGKWLACLTVYNEQPERRRKAA
jgi:hypothetical protein